MSFVHLHLHTQYSLLDGACRFGQLFDAAKANGQTAVAITDHGNMFGAIEFYKEAKKHGIKPIIGCEVYVAVRSRHDKVHSIDSERHHLVLLCENETGYKNLIKMVSESWTSGFYVKPRVDKELLEKYHEGIIALSGCLAGEIARKLVARDYDGAKQTALWYNSVFGQGNYYLEMQNHGLKEQLEIIPMLAKLSEETGIPLVATNDVHYVKKEDAKTQKVLICIQTNHTIDEETGIEFGTDDFYLKNEAEMLELFKNYPQAVKNTQIIADRCNVEFEFHKTKLPHFDVPDGRDHFDYFKEKCYEGLYKNYGENPDKKYIERLDYELSVIKNMGYVDYFLIVADFINYAKSKNIPVGPGRGSGAGSIAAYCMGITGIDPMKYNLIFERFLNPERVSMPDIDVDFCYVRREEVIDYVIRKYGADHVAQIVTFGTMAARAAIRDVGRVLGIAYNTVDAVSKQIPRELDITIDKALKKNAELKKMYDSDPKINELVNLAKAVEGMPRHASKHAAGVVITDRPVSEYVPLAKNDDSVVTQYTMTTIEELGLLKMDFLGLRTLTVIDDCVKAVREREPSFSIENIPLDDEKTYDLFRNGDTYGVFQCESAGLRRVLSRLKPNNLEDIIAVISLYRPGPMDSIPTFIRNRHHPEGITYKHPMLKNILQVTNGCIVYQEQVMQICRELAGYTFGQADLVRRAMAKKKADVMQNEKNHFIDGCSKNGISRQIATEIFEEMSSFASYAFNKPHAAAYAYVAYQTAYLKAHYPKEFWASMLTSVFENTEKILEYTNECRRIGIKILPPDINKGYSGFAVEGDNIRYGMAAVKNVGKSFVDYIVAEREKNGDYKGVFDFLNRMSDKSGFNKRGMESLAKVGAFDQFGINRRRLYINIENAMNSVNNTNRQKMDGQLDLFDLPSDVEDRADSVYKFDDDAGFPQAEEYTYIDKLHYEKELAGMYFSGHPLESNIEYVKNLSTCNISKLTNDGNRIYDNTKQTLVAIISKGRNHTTKKDEIMGFFTIEDLTSSMEMVVFPKLYRQCSDFLVQDKAIIVTGTIDIKDDKPTIIADEIYRVGSEEGKNLLSKKKNSKYGLYIKVKSKNDPVFREMPIHLMDFKGNIPVYFYFEDTKQYVLAPEKYWVRRSLALMDTIGFYAGKGNAVFVE